MAHAIPEFHPALTRARVRRTKRARCSLAGKSSSARRGAELWDSHGVTGSAPRFPYAPCPLGPQVPSGRRTIRQVPSVRSRS